MKKLENKQQILHLCALEVLNRCKDFENKEFRPTNIDECEKELTELSNKKWLTEEWMKSLAEASVNNCPILITLDNEWTWNILWGEPNQDENEFLSSVEKTLKQMRESDSEVKGNKVVFSKKKRRWGKNFFKK